MERLESLSALTISKDTAENMLKEMYEQCNDIEKQIAARKSRVLGMEEKEVKAKQIISQLKEEMIERIQQAEVCTIAKLSAKKEKEIQKTETCCPICTLSFPWGHYLMIQQTSEKQKETS